MSRIRARQLALVNWRGIFFAELDLDRHVTALEGDNGAGKTTALIATYIVLLPDLSRLRFTNLGEGEATGGDRGIWGRLGEAGRPAYAWVDFRREQTDDGERVLFGVQLRKGAEPAVELQTLAIRGLSTDIDLQDVLLERGEEDSIPELPELRAAVEAAGAQLEVFSSAKEYFAALFAAGITPLKLTDSDARGRFNEVLRASMTGGLSRGLTRDLKRFVLQPEEGLGITLRRMQENLDACHRSRVEVEHARRLQREIGDVNAAGQAMFAAAMSTARYAADEAGRKHADGVERAERLRSEIEALILRDTQLDGREKAIAEQLTEGKADASRARVRSDRVRQAREEVERIEQLDVRRPPMQEAVEAAQAALSSGQAKSESARQLRDERRLLLDEATRGLNDAEAGLEGLQLRVARHQRAKSTLDVARRALGEPDLEAEQAADERLDVQDRRAEVDEQRRGLRRERDTAQQRRVEFEPIHAALERCVGSTTPADAHAAAQELLAEERERKDRLARAAGLKRERGTLADEGRRRARVIERLAALFGPDAPRTKVALDARLEAAEAEAHLRAEQLREIERDHAVAGQAAALRRAERERARDTAARYADVRSAVDRLAGDWSHPIGSAEALRELHGILDDQAVEFDETARTADRRIKELVVALDALDEAGRGQSPALQAAAEAIDGRPLVARFDGVSVEEAPYVEARLGPLVDALIVDDIWEAAEAWPVDGPEQVWLIESHEAERRIETNGGLVEADGDAGFLAQYGDAWRLTQPPSTPIVGKAARAERRIALDAERAEHGQLGDDARARAAEVRAGRKRCAKLLERAALLDLVDPTGDLVRAEKAVADAESTIEGGRKARKEADAASRAAQTVLDALRASAPDGMLLDRADPAEALAAVEADLAALDTDKRWLSEDQSARRTVRGGLEVLRWPPPSADQIGVLEERLSLLDTDRDRLDQADEALRAFGEVRDALGDGKAVTELSELKLGHADARRRVEEARVAERAAEQGVRGAEKAFFEAREIASKAEGALSLVDGELEQVAERLESLGVGRPSVEDQRQAEQTVAGAEQAIHRLHAIERQLHGDRRGLDVKRGQLNQERQRADVEAKESHARWAPLKNRWLRLQGRLEEAGLLEQAVAAGATADAQIHRAQLVERLAHARDGAALSAEIAALPREPEADLTAWLKARAWLRRCLPARLAESPDPQHGLERLGGHLEGLEARLANQERVLSGDANDVAQHVRQLRRRARRYVDRLNELLAPISFGSIAGVRLNMSRIDHMELLLDGLGRQGDLFRPGMPIDLVLEELFHRVGGRGGGERLLDYREYFDLEVQVRRRSESNWRQANPTRMSTGEAIGVGAALMMVVLSAWEQQTRLTRRAEDGGTLRLLFLDEANRLSNDNLGVLFELCRVLDLQLLIAAPRVDEAEGNTTYRLTRVTTAIGHEEVTFMGRRLIVQPDAEGEDGEDVAQESLL